MSWISVTVADIATRLADPELDAARNALVAAGDPLPDIVSAVVAEVRGYVGACRTNRLGPAGTIPDELLNAALALIRGRLLSRLPVTSLDTDARRKEVDSAERLLREVAACRFVVSLPAEPAPAGDIPAPPRPSWSARPREFSRRQTDGA